MTKTAQTRLLRLAVLVSGSGTNLQAIIDGISQGQLAAEIVTVISSRADAYALIRAKRAGIPHKVLQPQDYPDREAYDSALAQHLRDAKVDLVVLAGFMRILSPGFVSQFEGRIINLHPSLLPSFPGLHAQRQALEYGVKITGCTVHFVDKGLDSGPIIVQRAVPVMEDDTEESLTQRIRREEHIALIQAIDLFAQGRLTVQGRRVIIAPEGENIS